MDKQTKNWLTSAERDWQTAKDLFKTAHYDACLFFCHLALEKSLKGLVALATNEPAPYVHDLERLARFAKLPLSEKQKENLLIITTFNIAGRYQDEKNLLYKKATKAYTEKYVNITENLFLWLKQQYPKK